ncbi:MAG: hypothetical protein ACK53Y_12075, partial [bacterium]
KQAFFCRKWNTKGHTTPLLSPMTRTMIVAASIGLLQQSSRKDVGFLVSLCYKDFQQRRIETAPRCRQIYMAKVRVAFWFQGRRRWLSKKKINIR